jgi:hypothetical protein
MADGFSTVAIGLVLRGSCINGENRGGAAFRAKSSTGATATGESGEGSILALSSW